MSRWFGLGGTVMVCKCFMAEDVFYRD
jgi:hypothetical protein